MSRVQGAVDPLRQRSLWVLGGLLLLGLILRLRSIGDGALFIDEGESSINALTILAHGYPTDSYLGLPLYENTLTEAWPESLEYEFRDTSYSSRGMAIYHGWLPLYAIAASLALHGILPDEPGGPLRVRHPVEEIPTRIRAARFPALVFGLVFIAATFLLGRSLLGDDVGLVAALVVTLAPKCVWLSQQARYYSAALALSTLAVVGAWSVYRNGRWRDALLSGFLFVLLFHTSSLAFALTLVPCTLLLPRVLRRPGGCARALAWLAIVTLGLVPWMLWTGFLAHHGRIPPAREWLEFPGDYFVYFQGRVGRALWAGLGAALLASAWFVRRRLPSRWSRPLEEAGFPALFLTVWTVGSFFGFQALVPAPSCSMARLSHALIAGPILLGALGVATVARALTPRWGTSAALLATLGGFLAVPDALEPQERNPYEAEAVFQLVDHLRTLELDPATRIYSIPYQHFCLTYYTGLPIQSIAPVRKSFLDAYPGPVLVLETTSRQPPPSWPRLQAAAREVEVELEESRASEWIRRVRAAMIRNEVTPLVQRLGPEAFEPAWIGAVAERLAREPLGSREGTNDYALDNPAMFRGGARLTIAEFWPAFFYRFVEPERRRGANLNYAERMREAEAWLLPSSWLLLHCPSRSGDLP